MAEDKDPFDILQVSPKASEDEIKAAYLKLARVHHPDVSSAPDAAVQFKEITEAYAVRALLRPISGFKQG
jgi:curved DNA-binding protein CbpA